MIGPEKKGLHVTRSNSILGVRFDSLDARMAVEIVESFVRGRRGIGARSVFFTNVHTIHLARNSREFKDTVNSADLVLPDGSGLKIAGRLFRTPVRENLNGTDLTPKVLRVAEREGWRVYLLGSARDVMTRCVARLRVMYPALNITGYREGFFTSDEEESVLQGINEKRPDILLVGLGSPRQEQWISRYAERLRAGVCLGVGGLFDFLAGRFRRAPLWMRQVGLEWAYRFAQDPKTKWDRIFIEIPEFLALVIANALFPRRTLKQAQKELP